MADEHNYKGLSLLDMIESLRESNRLLLERVTESDTRQQELEDKIASLEAKLNSAATDTTGSGDNDTPPAISLIYNRIVDELTTGKLVPLKTINSTTLNQMSLENLQAYINNKVVEKVEDLTGGYVAVPKADNASKLEGHTLNDLFKIIDIKLAQKYLTTGKFNIIETLVEQDTDRLPFDIAVNNRLTLVSIDGLVIPESKYHLDGNNVVFNDGVRAGSLVVFHSFKELVLLDDDNLLMLQNEIEQNRAEFLQRITEIVNSDTFIDSLISKIDEKIDDLEFVDGKIKIEDDAIYSADNGLDNQSDWGILHE